MAGNPAVLELLEEMLDSGKTPEEACAGRPELLPEVRQRWTQFCRIDAEVGALLPEPGTPPGAGAVTPVPPAAGLPQVPGYEVEGVLGRGGMGVVYKARHLRLNRTVALKMLLAGAYAGPHELARFQREAEAVAALRHANIVQVYDVADHEGRPYFTMEFVEGGSLAQKVAGLPQPARQAAALAATLAEAVQAAHQAGILHRDLKPANVLLTGDGTPRITDFGLARRLDGEAGPTQSGVPVGTPSYMAPEQARGQTRALGPATDVYALGAILYELLTGRPPFCAETAAETVLQVISQEPVPPARLNAALPRDLETVCLKCLQKDPGKRYPTAAELAADLGRFLKHEPIRARRTGRVEHCLRWVRRRPAAAGLLAAVVLLVLAAGVGAWLLYQQQAHQAQTDQEVRTALERARRLLEEGWQAADQAKLTEGRAAGERAEDIARSGGAGPAVRQEALAFREDAALRLGRGQKNRALVEALLDVAGPQERDAYPRDKRGRWMVLAQPSVDEQYAAAFRAWGLDVDGTAEAEVVRRLGAEPDPVVQELIAGLDNWMMERRQKHPRAQWRRLFRVADRLDRSERRRRLRALLVGGARPRAEGVTALLGAGSPGPALSEVACGSTWREALEVRKEIDPRTEPVLTVVLLARVFVAVGDSAGAEQVLRRAATARPDQVTLLGALAELLERQGPSRLADAIGYYRTVRSHRPHLGIALSNALIRGGRPAEVEELTQELLRRQPGHPAFHFYLGLAAYQQRKYGEAAAAFGKALDLKPDYAEACHNLGLALYEQNKPAEAEKVFREAIKLTPKYAMAYYNLGIALLRQGRLGEAEEAYREAIRLKPDYPEALNNRGNALLRQGRAGEAEADFRKAIALNPALAKPYHGLGNVLVGQRKYGEAEAAYRKAIALEPDFAEAYLNLGTALGWQQKPGGEAAFRKAIDLEPDFAEAHYNLGNALSGQGRHPEAEAAYRKAIDRKPDLVDAYHNLGNALSHQGKLAEAEAAYRQAIDRKPDLAEAFLGLGAALLRQRKPAEAEAALRQAIDRKPDFGLACHHLGIALMRQARFDEAAALLKKAGELFPASHPYREQARQLRQRCQRYAILGPRLSAILRGTEKAASAAEQIELARLCLLKKANAAAARFCRDAFTAEPKLAEAVPASARYDGACAAALAGCGQGKDADELDDKERALWRRQALDWLRQDLAWWGKAQGKGNAQVGQRLRHWQTDDDLAGVRGKDALARLPDEERKQWERLWSDVEKLASRDPSLKLEQARACVARKQWARAAELYGECMKDAPTPDGEVWFEYAAVQLLSEDRSGYRETCRQMLAAARGPDKMRPYLAARACTLAPDAVDDLAVVSRVSTDELEEHASAFWSLTEQGALRCRTGRPGEAVPPCKRSLELEPRPGAAVLNWLWLALAYQKLGEREQARVWLDKAGAWLDALGGEMPANADALNLHRHNWLEAHVLRREAAALLPPPAK